MDFAKNIVHIDMIEKIVAHINENTPECLRNMSDIEKIAKETGRDKDEILVSLEYEFNSWKEENGVSDFNLRMAEFANSFVAEMTESGEYDAEDVAKSINTISSILNFSSEDAYVLSYLNIKENIPNNPYKDIMKIYEMIDELPAIPINAIDYIKEKIDELG